MSKTDRVRKAMIEVIEAMGTEWAADKIIELRKKLDDAQQEANRAWHRENERDNQRRGAGY